MTHKELEEDNTKLVETLKISVELIDRLLTLMEVNGNGNAFVRYKFKSIVDMLGQKVADNPFVSFEGERKQAAPLIKDAMDLIADYADYLEDHAELVKLQEVNMWLASARVWMEQEEA